MIINGCDPLTRRYLLTTVFQFTRREQDEFSADDVDILLDWLKP